MTNKETAGTKNENKTTSACPLPTEIRRLAMQEAWRDLKRLETKAREKGKLLPPGILGTLYSRHYKQIKEETQRLCEAMTVEEALATLEEKEEE